MRAYTVRVLVEPRAGLLDPQGEAVGRALRELGMEGLEEVRVGKVIRLTIRAPSPEAAAQRASWAAEKLLCNPVIEEFRVEVP